MSLLDLFKRDAACENCGLRINKRQLSGFDATLRGKRQSPDKLRLCRSCLSEIVSKYFRAFPAKAVAVYPVQGLNAYQFYSFEYMAAIPGWGAAYTDEQIDHFRKLLPPDRSQCRCGTKANFNWCSPAMFNDYPWAEKGFSPPGTFDQRFLCGACVSKELIAVIEADDLVLDEFLPPVDSGGMIISFEA